MSQYYQKLKAVISILLTLLNQKITRQPQLAASLNTLIDKVDDVSSKEPDTTKHVENAVAPLAESMGTLQAALSRLEDNFQQIAAMGQQESPEMSKLTHAMADLHGKIQDLANSDAADRLDGLTGEVAGLKTMLTDSIPHVSRSVEAMQSRVTALTEIAQRLDDMDPKRGFDRIEAGLGTISQNADATLRGVQDVCAWVQNGEMGDQITSLTGKIDAVLGRGGNTDGEDALYDQAVAIVIKDRKCSTSYIQRKLAIGYNKAARLVEQMEDEGVVSSANHVGKREILVPEQ